MRRSTSAPGSYAITVQEGGGTARSYQVTDLGLGQVGAGHGQAFASLEHLLEFFYDTPFPARGDGHVPLKYMYVLCVRVCVCVCVCVLTLVLQA